MDDHVRSVEMFRLWGWEYYGYIAPGDVTVHPKASDIETYADTICI